MNKLLNILAIGGIWIFGASQNANATNYFNWGVETNSFNACCDNNYGSILGFKDGSSRSSDTAHSGTYSMKLQIHGDDNYNQGTGADLGYWNKYPRNVVGSGPLYYRWWMKIMPGFNWGNDRAKTKASRTIGVAYTRVYTGVINKDSFAITECEETGSVQPGGGCLTPSGVPDNDFNLNIPFDMTSMADGQWHEYVMMVKPNSTTTSMDAEFKAWVDGVLVGQLMNWKLHDESNNQMQEAWMGWMVQPYFQLGNTGPTGGGTIYVDDFSTDDTFNSTYSGGGDIAPPTNLKITAPSASATLSGTVTVSGTCTDETSVRGVQFKYGTTNIGSEDTSSPYSVSWDTTAVPNGTYSLTAVCTDNGGNRTTSSAQSVTVSNTINTVSAQACPSNWKALYPTWIYCDDFETDKSNLYVDSNYYGSRLVRSSGNGLNSSYSLRSTFPAAPGAASNGGDFTIAFGASPVSPTVNATDTTKYRELYWRAYIKTQAGWQPGTGQKLTRATSFHNSSWAQSMIAHWWGSSASPENTLQVDPASGVCRGGVYPAGSPSCTNNTVITTGWNDFNGLYWLGASKGTAPVLGTAKANTWQCIEGYVKLNDSGQTNGVQTLWVDGVQDATKTGLNFVGTDSTYGINIFRIENYMNTGVSQSQYRDWDNLVLSTTRIGCSISGDSNTLTAPAELIIK